MYRTLLQAGKRIATWSLCLVFFADAVVANEVSYSRDVQPLLAKRCFVCHGPDAAEGGLALHQRDAALAEADSGEAAIVPAKPEQSELLRRVSSVDPHDRMPLDEDPLSANEIETLRKWIQQGAQFEKHWAFVPRTQVDLPEVAGRDWVSNPIDQFILAKLERNGLTPSAPAQRRVLARRVYYDVIGLPPTPEQLNDFLNDKSPDAYERLVDRLLASPHYGERWGRHWLDVVRYAESNSFERDATKPFAWKYRDYVIRSFNEDKPYDQFIQEQLAGDELDELTEESIIATGYYRLGTWDDEPADPLQSRYDDLDNIVSTTSQAFLGLTVGCARCHDHKIDPIPQTDYYGMLAFFADVTPYALPADRSAHVHSLWDLSQPEVKRKRSKLRSAKKTLAAEKHELEQQAIARMEGADQRLTETESREKVLKQKLPQYQSQEESARYAQVSARLKKFRRQLRKLTPGNWALSLAKCYPQPEQMHVMLRGNAHALGDPVEPRYPEIFGDEPPAIAKAPADARSAGRRRVLAHWMTNPDNLLTSRVIANRIWQHHFGRGIVRSANNFGQLGTLPTHPELLDWLAGYLVDHGWRLKELHRLILTSNAYRMSSDGNASALAVDPTNDLYWRFDKRRLSAEELRDSVLMISGQLNDKLYGPSIYPKLSDEVLATQSRPGHDWHTSKPSAAARRSIYIHIKRSLIPPSLAAFDFPPTDTSCEARFNTTQAAQALNLLHSEFMQTQAGYLAQRVRHEAGESPADQISRALQLCLQHEPDDETVQDCLQLRDHLLTVHGIDESHALAEICLLVLNLNEFVYLD